MKNIIILGVVLVLVLLRMSVATAQTTGEKMVKIKITSGDMVVLARLNNNATAQDLLKRLPLVLNMNLHQNREYYANIRLDKNAKIQDGYQVGDIAYWTSGNALVMFFGEGYTDDLIIMGQIITGLDKLSNMGGNFQAKIEKNEE